MALEDRDRAARARSRRRWRSCVAAHADVGGDIVSAGGTGTYDLHATTGVTEVQAGSYALMDTAYAKLGLPFEQALFVVGTVISVRPSHAVADVGLKALGMDHGNPSIDGATRVVLQRRARHVRAGRRAHRPSATGCAWSPAHVDPTMAMHEVAWLVDGDEVLERWADRPARLGMSQTARARWPGSPSPGWPSAPSARGSSRVRWRWSTAVRVADAVVGAVGRARSPSAPRVTGRRRLAVAVRRRRRWPAWRWPRRSSSPRRQPAADPAARPLRDHPRQPAVHQPPGAPTCPPRSPRSTPTSSRSASSRRRHAARLPAIVARRRATRTASSCRRALASGTGAVEPLPGDRARRRRPTKHHTVVADVARARRRRPGHRAPHPEPDRPPRPVGARPRAARRTLTVDRPGRDDRRLQRQLVAPGVPPPPARRRLARRPHRVRPRAVVLVADGPVAPGRSTSHPPFVRLDHALVNDGLAVLDVDDFDVPGSDHRGLVVTVQRAAPAAP